MNEKVEFMEHVQRDQLLRLISSQVGYETITALAVQAGFSSRDAQTLWSKLSHRARIILGEIGK